MDTGNGRADLSLPQDKICWPCEEIKASGMGLAFAFRTFQEGHLKREFISTVINKELPPKSTLWLGILVCDISNFGYIFYHLEIYAILSMWT